MNDLYAIVPASAIILIIAIRKILAPVKFNEEIFGEIHPDEINNAKQQQGSCEHPFRMHWLGCLLIGQHGH